MVSTVIPQGRDDINETALIVEIRKMIDVDIEIGNEVLEEAIGMEGEINIPQ